jgi:hypothetical protein
MLRVDDSFVFQRVTTGLRKPAVRFHLASGRSVELRGFHLEPAWSSTGEVWRLKLEEVARRLYPNESPVVVGHPACGEGPAFLCAAYFFSDSPTRSERSANYSVLLVCGLVEDIDKGVRGIVCELLSQVDWEACATDDFMW